MQVPQSQQKMYSVWRSIFVPWSFSPYKPFSLKNRKQIQQWRVIIKWMILTSRLESGNTKNHRATVKIPEGQRWVKQRDNKLILSLQGNWARFAILSLQSLCSLSFSLTHILCVCRQGHLEKCLWHIAGVEKASLESHIYQMHYEFSPDWGQFRGVWVKIFPLLNEACLASNQFLLSADGNR